jgi:hypothetical protein
MSLFTTGPVAAPLRRDAGAPHRAVGAGRAVRANCYLSHSRTAISSRFPALKKMRAIRAVPGLATNLSARPYIRGALLSDVLVRAAKS